MSASLSYFAAELDVEDNYLTGDLWPISKMGKIEYFFAYDNMLGGETTKDPYSNGTRSYGDLESSPILQATSLKALDLSTNYYYGTIPPSIANMNKLEELYLEDDELEGGIIPELFGLPRLEKLYLGTNYLTSTLPAEVGNAKSLSKDCSIFHCFYPSSFSLNLRLFLLLYIASFRAQDNYRQRDNGSIRSKGIMGTIPMSIANLERLEDLRLENNFISGTLHAEMGNLRNLVRMRLDLNVLRGSIPASFANLVSLKTFALSGNYMTGSLHPPGLKYSTHLTTLDLHDNSFSGTMPSEWGGLHNLTALDVSYNQLTG